MSWQELIANAEITFGFIKGTGLGAVLLTIVAVVFLIKNRVLPSDLSAIASALRPKVSPRQSKPDGQDIPARSTLQLETAKLKRLDT